MTAVVRTVACGVWELSVRRYLQGFSDAVVPEATTRREKVEAIFAWMRTGPPRLKNSSGVSVSAYDPEDTLETYYVPSKGHCTHEPGLHWNMSIPEHLGGGGNVYTLVDAFWSSRAEC